MGNVRRVHTQISVLARRSPNALHASSCKTDWLRGWCHRRPMPYTLALFLFPFATINITVCVCERMWRLPVFHASWCIAMTRCRAIRHALQDSLRDPVNEAAVADDGGGEHRNRTHDYTRMRNAHLRSLASNSRARNRVANGCWARRVFSREISSRLNVWRIID